ncbi:MAG: C39 family peptidase [Planctomycetes bacterium]|nr:C39 family peptidase [Planctomycetota bacterium]
MDTIRFRVQRSLVVLLLAMCWSCSGSGGGTTPAAQPGPGPGTGSGPGTGAGPGPNAVRLQIPFRGQQTAVWCWAATAEMVLTYSGNPIPQCQMVSNWAHLPCCSIPLAACAFAAPSIEFIQQTLFFEGLASQRAGRALSFSEVRENVLQGRPMILCYQGSFGGHVVVVYGYDDTSPGDPYIFVHDPFYGSFYVPYATSGLYSGSSVWVDTIVTLPNSARSAGWALLEFEEVDWSRVPQFEDDGRDPDAESRLWR